MDTIRRQLIALLRANEMGAREISRALGIREKAVYEHLPHVAKTLAGLKEKLAMAPPECLSCGYVFADRSRVTRPGRCPRCRGTRVAAPVYRISARL
jgi:predicted Zn-ribbon and HTH transcriptional regulator